MIFWLVLELEISYRVIICWRILVSFRGFSEEATYTSERPSRARFYYYKLVLTGKKMGVLEHLHRYSVCHSG
jgi:hypothetical protein